MTQVEFPFAPGAELLLEKRYLAKDQAGRVVETPAQMLARVAGAVAQGELAHGGEAARREMERRFLELLGQGLFVPNSPTLMNAGRPLGQLSACFVLPVGDSLESIFEAVKLTALIHKSGGGTGFSFSELRPAGDKVASTGGVSSGPVSFMQVFDAATQAIKQGGTRRGANMGMLSARHPDIETFITAKLQPGAFANFNLSVMIDDAFMRAARSGDDWELIHPGDQTVWRKIPAAELMALLVSSAHASGEPGVAFYDAINRANPTLHLGAIQATNPCGEQPLLPYESCNLGSLVLPRFAAGGAVDYAKLEQAAMEAVRFLDDALETNNFPVPQVARATKLTRKVGLGVMGFADLLLDLGIPYASAEAEKLGAQLMGRIQAAARQASRELGQERGSFEAFFGSSHQKAGEKAMRNASVTTVAPTGSIAILMGCSSGIEPHFALAYTRRMLDGEVLVEHNPRFVARLKALGLDSKENLAALAATGSARAIKGLPDKDAALFAAAHEIAPQRHLAVQAAFQRFTDNGVSKTVNLSASADTGQVSDIIQQAFDLGLKGITVFRHGCRGRQVLELLPLPGEDPKPSPALGNERCPRCGGSLATDGGCRSCPFCGASGCE